MAAKTQAVQFYLPPGRIVMGSTHEVQTKDQQGRDREKPTIFFAVAVPKTDPNVAAILTTINQVAWAHYQNITHIADQLKQGLNAPNFAWKVEDGDSAKNKDREGFAGCWVFRFSTSIFPIKAGDVNNSPIDPAMIKTGYYVDVSASCAPNGLTDKNAGVYLNPNGVRLLGYGKEIQTGPTIGQMFAQHTPQLPPGASALPVADGNPLGGPAPAAPPAGMPGVGAPPPPATPPAPPPAGLGASAPAAPPPPPVMTVEQIQAESAALAAAAGVQHYPGHRIKPDRSGYDPDPTPAPTAATPGGPITPGMTANPLGGPVAGVSPPSSPTPPAGIAGASGVPAGASPGPALGTAPNGSPGIASPSNPPAGVQPHPQFLNPPAAPKTPDEISAEIAAANGVQHYPGYRLDVTSRQYLPNPTH